MSTAAATPEDRPSNAVIRWYEDNLDAAFGFRDPDVALLEQVLDGLIATVDDEAAR